MRKWLSAEAAGRRIGKHAKTVIAAINAGEIVAKQAKGRWQVDVASLDEYAGRPEMTEIDRLKERIARIEQTQMNMQAQILRLLNQRPQSGDKLSTKRGVARFLVRHVDGVSVRTMETWPLPMNDPVGALIEARKQAARYRSGVRNVHQCVVVDGVTEQCACHSIPDLPPAPSASQ